MSILDISLAQVQVFTCIWFLLPALQKIQFHSGMKYWKESKISKLSEINPYSSLLLSQKSLNKFVEFILQSTITWKFNELIFFLDRKISSVSAAKVWYYNINMTLEKCGLSLLSVLSGFALNIFLKYFFLRNPWQQLAYP